MQQFLGLNTALTIQAINPTLTLISSETQEFLLQSSLPQQILRLLSQTPQSTEALLQALEQQQLAVPAKCLRAINQLQQHDIVQFVPITQSHSHQQSPLNEQQMTLATGHIVIESIINEPKSRTTQPMIHSFAELLSKSKLPRLAASKLASYSETEAQQANSQATNSFRIILTDDMLAPELTAINQRQLIQQEPWVLVKATGQQLLVSPLFIPNVTACWECLAYRMRSHRPLQSLINAQTQCLQRACQTPSQRALATIVHLLEQQLATTADNVINDAMLIAATVDSASIAEGACTAEGSNEIGKNNTVTRHQVSLRPQCRACGQPQTNIDYKARLAAVPTTKINNTQGGFRSVSPETTFTRYQHLISPICGILSDISEYKSIANAPIHNFSSGRNTALQSKTLFWLNKHMRSANGGKGKTAQQAKTGALCEAIERYCLAHHQQQADAHGSLQQLAPKTIHPNECMNFSDSQFAHREQQNQECESFYAMTPRPLQHQEAIDWTQVYSLTKHTYRLLPSEFCYAQYQPTTHDEKQLIAYPDSNGCASGNTLHEAILQGTLELIERDAAAIWWYNKLIRPSVNLDTLPQEQATYINTIRSYYQQIGRQLIVLDITTDIGVPTFVAVSWLTQSGTEILYGFGCHLDAFLAIERSIIELNQLLPIAVTAPKERNAQKGHKICNWLDNQSIEQHPYLGANSLPQRHLHDIQNKANTHFSHTHFINSPEQTIQSATEQLITALEKVDIELFVLDLTQPDIAMPVVKMIAPGLRHYWRRTAPGRLYQVPVKMGWQAAPLSENQLNEHSITI